MVMDIAAMSMGMKAADIQQSLSIAVLKDTMDQQSVAVDQLMRTMEAAVSGLGMNLDVYA